MLHPVHPDRRGDLHRGAALGAEVYRALRLGDEGGFAPDLEHNRAALDLIVEAIGKAGFTPGQDVALAIDAAASEFYADGVYNFERGPSWVTACYAWPLSAT